MMSNPITQTRILYYTGILLNISINYNKSIDVGKPYIHYIAGNVNNVSRKSLDGHP
jgi:hypothetical protein